MQTHRYTHTLEQSHKSSLTTGEHVGFTMCL
uniref:Uncharacterized protein n=1 Tax=Anguilla anguilla TaxID=7936 RepID=A0A0E9SIX8_ANGAN